VVIVVRTIKDKGQAPENRVAPPTELQKNLCITKEEVARCVDTPYVIDADKRSRANEKPRFTK